MPLWRRQSSAVADSHLSMFKSDPQGGLLGRSLGLDSASLETKVESNG